MTLHRPLTTDRTGANLRRKMQEDDARGDIGRPHGACNHTGYAEFDHLTGYVTGRYASEWTDKQGNRWRTVTTIINLGRPDRGVAVDHNAQMAEETWQDDRPERVKNYSASVAAARERRHSAIMETFTAHMQEHGPVPVNDLMALLGKSRNTILDHLAMHPQTYRCFPGQPDHYGLHGQQRTETGPQYTGVIARARDALLAYGPMTASELATRINADVINLRTVLPKRDDLFVRVGTVQVPGARTPVIVWGVVG